MIMHHYKQIKLPFMVSTYQTIVKGKRHSNTLNTLIEIILCYFIRNVEISNLHFVS